MQLINSLKDSVGNAFEGQMQIAKLAVDYFQGFLGKTDHNVIPCHFLEELLPKIPNDAASALGKEVTGEEI